MAAERTPTGVPSEARDALRDLTSAVASITEELTCAICMCAVTDPVVLLCGHIGCSHCMSEWLSRKSDCPSCRAVMPAENSSVKCFPLDTVMSCVHSMEPLLETLRVDLATRRVASPVPTAAGEPASLIDSRAEVPLGLEVIDSMFRDHLSSMLRTYSTYLQGLQQTRDAMLRASAADPASFPDGGTVARRQYETEYRALLDDVRAFLGKALPPIASLPVFIIVHIPSLALSFNLSVRATDSITSCVLPAIRSTLKDKFGSDVVDFPTDCAWHLMSGDEMVHANCDVAIPLSEQCPHGRPPPGSKLVVLGNVSRPTSVVGSCAVDRWQPGMKENYYWCTTCGLKWICSACSQCCHKGKGHQVVLFLSQHAPTFACCYCRSRTKNCGVPPGQPATADASSVSSPAHGCAHAPGADTSRAGGAAATVAPPPAGTLIDASSGERARPRPPAATSDLVAGAVPPATRTATDATSVGAVASAGGILRRIFS
ncbi:hypothetical protein EON62_02485 [archaeon]|nr:MAG: hypothetical protein EON62_02485 [archaeon]